MKNNPTTQNIIEEAIKKFDEQFPCIQLGCDNEGTIAERSNNGDDWDKYQCQYCCEQRLDKKQFIEKELQTAITTAREGVVREILGLSHYKRDDSGLDWVIQVTDIEKLLSTLKGNHD